MNDLYEGLVQHTKALVDRRGEAHIACPQCGRTSTPRDPHCSFNWEGFFCFACGHKASLEKLAQEVGLASGCYEAPKRPEPVRKPQTARYDADLFAQQCEMHPDAWHLWQAYKPVSRAQFEAMRLGAGTLPLSQCKHTRLIVPIIDGTMVVGVRGRAIDCSCPKWLAPGGTDISLYPLYNEQALKPGCVAMIVENPVDALLVTEHTPYTGAACYSTSYWQERWTAALKMARPKLVIVALDNDLVGNGGAKRRDEFSEAWLKSHPRLPEARGIALVNRLLKDGLRAILWDWGRSEYKADMGSMVLAGAL